MIFSFFFQLGRGEITWARKRRRLGLGVKGDPKMESVPKVYQKQLRAFMKQYHIPQKCICVKRFAPSIPPGVLWIELEAKEKEYVASGQWVIEVVYGSICYQEEMFYVVRILEKSSGKRIHARLPHSYFRCKKRYQGASFAIEYCFTSVNRKVKIVKYHGFPQLEVTDEVIRKV